MLTYTFIVVPDNEQPEYNKYFAYLEDDYDKMMYQGGYGKPGPFPEYPTRGAGDTPSEAIACLCALLNAEGVAKGNNKPENIPWATKAARKGFIGY